MPNFLREDYGIRQAMADTAAPTSGTWNTFDYVENSAPAAGTPVGWICTAGGTSGTWKAVYPLQNVANVATALTAAGSAAVTDNIVPVTGSGAHNITLAAPTAANSGSRLSIVNTSSGTVTAVAATGTAITGLATAATNTSAEFLSAGTNWYRV